MKAAPWGVTTTVSVLLPTLRLSGALALPEGTATPLTVTVEVALSATGVTVTEAAAFGTEAAYAMTAGEKSGNRTPSLNLRSASDADLLVMNVRSSP